MLPDSCPPRLSTGGIAPTRRRSSGSSRRRRPRPRRDPAARSRRDPRRRRRASSGGAPRDATGLDVGARPRACSSTRPAARRVSRETPNMRASHRDVRCSGPGSGSLGQPRLVDIVTGRAPPGSGTASRRDPRGASDRQMVWTRSWLMARTPARSGPERREPRGRSARRRARTGAGRRRERNRRRSQRRADVARARCAARRGRPPLARGPRRRPRRDASVPYGLRPARRRRCSPSGRAGCRPARAAGSVHSASWTMRDTARAVTHGACSRSHTVSARAVCTVTFVRPSWATVPDSHRCAEQRLDEVQVRSGRAMARARPGRPAPDPTSMTCCVSPLRGSPRGRRRS